MNTKLQYLLLLLALDPATRGRAGDPIPETAVPSVIVNTKSEPVTAGKFQPTWDSLKQYQAPEWFRDAKFGIWAVGARNARRKTATGTRATCMFKATSKMHTTLPTTARLPNLDSRTLFTPGKPRILTRKNSWLSTNEPALKYFCAMANHHDNFDLWDSRYQPWNAVKIGPQKDLIAGWAKAAHDQRPAFRRQHPRLPFAWSWYEITQSADKTGPLAGVPYDGKLTKADGKGKWWDGLDPQDLYEQRHTPSPNFADANAIHSRWDWNNGVSLPDQAYCDKFYNRTVDLMHKYKPDFDAL